MSIEQHKNDPLSNLSDETPVVDFREEDKKDPIKNEEEQDLMGELQKDTKQPETNKTAQLPTDNDGLDKQPPTDSLPTVDDDPFKKESPEDNTAVEGENAYKKLIENRDKSLQQKEDEIYKLKIINEKLKEQLKMLSTNLDQALDKMKYKNKKTNFYDVEEKAKDKELQGIDVQITDAQKSIKILKAQIESNPGLDKVIDLENRIKEVEISNKKYQQEIDSLKIVARNQTIVLQANELTEEQKGKLTELEEKLSTIRTKTRVLEEEYNTIRKESEKKHKKLISLKERHKMLNEKINASAKSNTEEDTKTQIAEKEEAIKALTKKHEELEKYRAKKKKQYEKDYDALNKQIADSELQIEESKKVKHSTDIQEKRRRSKRTQEEH